jgi:GNAT superfamily N-acetyltransferase
MSTRSSQYWHARETIVVVEVRPALPSDADHMLPLIHAHAAFERGTASCTATALRSALSGEPVRLLGWVAEQERQLIGYAAATVDFSTWNGRSYLHLDCLFVKSGHRGSGIGAQLFEAACSHATSENIPELQWQTPEWNADARRFYVRGGASVVPKLRFQLVLPNRS